jgi:hypothetical protein
MAKGKILKGYLTAFSSAMVVGNPDINNLARISSIAMGPTSSPNGVSVIWGFFNGYVALTSVMAVMKDGAQIRSHLSVCTDDEKHRHMVTKVVHLADGHWATTDTVGQLKVWEGRNKKLRCLWTSPPNIGHPIEQIVANLQLGLLITSCVGDEIVIWTGMEPETPNWQEPVRSISIRPSFQDPLSMTPGDLAIKSPPVLSLEPNASKTRFVLLFAGYRSQFPEFSKIEVVLTESSANTTWTRFSDSIETAILAIAPSFRAASDETDFIISGDAWGGLAVWNWKTSSYNHAARSLKSWISQGDGGISQISVDDSIFVTGRRVLRYFHVRYRSYLSRQHSRECNYPLHPNIATAPHLLCAACV